MKASARWPIVVLILTAVCRPAVAADPPGDKFIEALRKRQYFDVAIDFLDRMRADADYPAEMKQRIDYDIGMTWLDAANATQSNATRERMFDAATAAIQKFLQTQPTHQLANDANTQIGRLLLLRGSMRAQQAEEEGLSPAEKKTHLEEARKLYDQAQGALEAAENLCYEKAKALNSRVEFDPNATLKQDLNDAYGKLLQVRLFLINVAEQRGRTYPPGSGEFKKQLASAAKRYNEFFEKDDNRVAGLQARNFEGRIHRDLDQHQKAIDVFREMLTIQDQEPAFRQVKLNAILLLMETYLKPELKEYDEALAIAAAWKEEARGNEETSSEGLEVQILAGRAAIESAKTLEPNDDNRKDFVRTARRYLTFVQRVRGPLGKEATDLLADEFFGAVEISAAEPADFEEAYERAKVAFLTLTTTEAQLRNAPAAKKAELADALETARGNMLKFSLLARDLADAETKEAELNEVRFYLAYACFGLGRQYEAAVLGELLAFRYPAGAQAQAGAEIAVTAYRILFVNEQREGRDTSFEQAQIERVADYVTTRWEGEKVAEKAWLMLFDTAVDLKDTDRANECLAKLPPDSDSRGKAEMRLGQRYWSEYVRQANLDEDERPDQEELDALVKNAQDTLRRGVDRMSKAVEAGGAVDYNLAYSTLNLAKILVDAGNAEEAVKLLEDPTIGPVALVNGTAPAIAGRTDYEIDTLKTALRAYVGVKNTAQAQAVMGRLEELVGQGDAEGAKRLTHIYISLGKQLEERLARLRNEGKDAEVAEVSEAFEAFLTKISQAEGASFNSLNWVAHTLFSLGAGLDPGDGPVPAKAHDYYKKAGATYQAILASKPEDMPEGADTSIQVRQAVCLRGMGRAVAGQDAAAALGQFKLALIQLAGILRQKETRVDVQMEAARTYQQLAAALDQPRFYKFAIEGGQKKADGYNLVWGWNGISRRVASNEQYRHIFHEARYNIALCRKRFAETQTGEERTKTLKQAESDIVVTEKLYPKMGGTEQRAQYDALLKEIRELQGTKNPEGLPPPPK